MEAMAGIEFKLNSRSRGLSGQCRVKRHQGCVLTAPSLLGPYLSSVNHASANQRETRHAQEAY